MENRIPGGGRYGREMLHGHRDFNKSVEEVALTGSLNRGDTVEMGQGGSFLSLSGFMGRIFGKRDADALHPSAPVTATPAEVASSAAVAVSASTAAASVPGPVGAVLAGQVISRANAARTWDDTRESLARGFQEILDSPQAGQGEKDMASFGKAALSMTGRSDIGAFLGTTVMTAIAGGKGQVDMTTLAREMKSRADNASTWDDALLNHQAGFTAIEAYPLASAEDRTHAAFALKVLDYPFEADVRAKICSCIARTVADRRQTMDVAGFMREMQLNANNSSTWIDARKALKAGFRAVEEYPGSSPDEKKIAAYGTALLHKVADDARACALAALMSEALQRHSSKVRPERIAETAISGASSSRSWSDALDVYRDAFAMLGDSPDATDGEKEFSAWGQAVAGLNGPANGIAALAGHMMSTLKKGAADMDLEGLARCAIQNGNSASSWSDAVDVLCAAFRAVEISPFAGQDLKIFAARGYRDTRRGPASQDGFEAGSKLLKEMIDSGKRKELYRQELQEMAESLVPGDNNPAVTLDEEFIEVDGVRLKRREEPSPGSPPASA